MDSGQIVALVGGILALLALIFVPLGVILHRRGARSAERLVGDVAEEPALKGPESAVYRGSTGSYPKVNGNGKLLLTTKRLIFRILIGTDVVVPLSEISGIREARTFRRSVMAGKMHLVFETASGEIGFFTDDNAAWIAAVEAARSAL